MYWLFKSEEKEFSVEDFFKEPDLTTEWDGIRNYQARNYLKKDVRKGDLGFFYHSNCRMPAIVGIVEVVAAAYPDHSQFKPDSRYYDPKSNRANPRWFSIKIKLLKKLNKAIPLATLKSYSNAELKNMALFKSARLSVQPVAPAEWEFIRTLFEESK